MGAGISASHVPYKGTSEALIEIVAGRLDWLYTPAASVVSLLKDGKGKANDLFASLDGWLVSKQAPKETVDFFKVWLGKEPQTKLAAEGLFAGTQESAQFVRRTGSIVVTQTFNGCVIGGDTCLPVRAEPVFERPPAAMDGADAMIQAAGGGSISFTFSEPNTSQVPAPAALDISGTIVVNQGNEWLFNSTEEERRERADKGGK